MPASPARSWRRLYDAGPAAEAGLQVGDVIVAVDGREVADARAIQYRLTTRGIGNRCRLDVVRKGRQLSVDVALRAAPQAGKDDVRNLSGAHPFDGARVGNILPGTADELGIEDQEGVVILPVRPELEGGAPRLPAGRHHPADRAREDRRRWPSSRPLLKERQQVWLVVLKRGNQTVRLQLAG